MIFHILDLTLLEMSSIMEKKIDFVMVMRVQLKDFPELYTRFSQNRIFGVGIITPPLVKFDPVKISV